MRGGASGVSHFFKLIQVLIFARFTPCAQRGSSPLLGTIFNFSFSFPTLKSLKKSRVLERYRSTFLELVPFKVHTHGHLFEKTIVKMRVALHGHFYF